jgi:hypothetical protein
VELIEAIEKGNIEVVKQCLAVGADVNIKWRRLADYVHGPFVLHLAVHWGHGEIVELLITEGADVNAKANDGRTPLDVAIKHERTEVTDLLRNHGGKTLEEL